MNENTRDTGGVSTPSASSRPCTVRQVDAAGRVVESGDRLAVESPLQVIVNGEPFAVIMRTPGDDEDLVAGFLLAEGVLSDAPPGSFERSRNTSGRDVLAVNLGAAPGVARRRVDVNAACGMCGRVSVESIDVDRAPLDARWSVPAAIVAELPARLRAAQPVFDDTGGLHAAGVFDLSGSLVASAEDVGRHNAVDKVVGRLLRAGRLPLEASILAVSGRLAFEIVQKALLAGVPLVAAVSAPSSLAVDLAQAAGITLVGFARNGAFNVYTHGGRIGVSDELRSTSYE
jgi:FdhD protein